MKFTYDPDSSRTVLVAQTALVMLAALGLAACSSRGSGSGDPQSSSADWMTGDGGAADAATADAGNADSGAQSEDAAEADAIAPGDAGCNATSAPAVYVESNIPVAGRNSILGFTRGVDGSLTPMVGSPFLTGGTGLANPTQALGPDDSDSQIIVSADHAHLYAVNGGSDTVAAFDIAVDGQLVTVAGSPFATGGMAPASLGIAGEDLIVANKGQVGSATCDTSPEPNYTKLDIRADGGLRLLPGTTTPASGSPAQILVSLDGKHAFGDDFMAPKPLRSFLVRDDRALLDAKGSPMAIPNATKTNGDALGMAQNPKGNTLYVGFVDRAQVGVYRWDASGMLSFVTTAPAGQAVCWLRTNAQGTRLYAVNSGEGSISVYDTTNPIAPRELQRLVLNDLGPAFLDPNGAKQPFSSEPFQIALDPTGAFLYVVTQRVTTNGDVTAGNAIHILAVDARGMVSETMNDVKLDLPVGARAQGIVAL